jgi:hypothetical protein
VESRRLAEPLITLAIGVMVVASIVYTLDSYAAVITRDDIGKVRVNKDETSTRCPESEGCDEY